MHTNCKHSKIQKEDKFCPDCGIASEKINRTDQNQGDNANHNTDDNGKSLNCTIYTDQDAQSNLGKIIGASFGHLNINSANFFIDNNSDNTDQTKIIASSNVIGIEHVISLLNILSDYSALINHRLLVDLFRMSLPPRAKTINRRISIFSVVEHLYDILPAEDHFHPLLIFVKNLLKRVEDEIFQRKLKEWIKTVVSMNISDIELNCCDLIDTEETDQSDSIDSINITVRLFLHELNKRFSNNKFSIEVKSRIIYKNKKCKTTCLYKPKQKYTFKGKVTESYGIEEIPEKIGDILDLTLNSQIFADKDMIDTIEFILPYDMIHLGVDQWKRKKLYPLYNSEEKTKYKKIIEDYRVITRIDRFKVGYEDVPRECRAKWHKNWNHFIRITELTHTEECVYWKDDSACIDIDHIKEHIFNPNNKLSCIMMTSFPRSEKRIKELGLEILDRGIPVALWFRKCRKEIINHEEIKNEMIKMCNGYDLLQLPSLVHYKRQTTELCVLKNYLSLLWDDPSILSDDENN